MGSEWQNAIDAEAAARQSTERARRHVPENEIVFPLRNSLQRRYDIARGNTMVSANDGNDEERDDAPWLEQGVQELNPRLPSPRSNALHTSPRQINRVELATNYNVQSPSSSIADDLTPRELKSEIERQKIHIEQVQAQLSEKNSQIRLLLDEKRTNEEAHLQATLNGQERETERLERITSKLAEQLRIARADKEQLDAQVLEGRAREDELRRQMHEKERQMDERERHYSVQIHNARLRQLQAEADLEAARISPRLVTETVPQSSQQSQSQRRSSTSSHRPPSTRSKDTKLCFSVPRGSRGAPIVAELIKQQIWR